MVDRGCIMRVGGLGLKIEVLQGVADDTAYMHLCSASPIWPYGASKRRRTASPKNQGFYQSSPIGFSDRRCYARPTFCYAIIHNDIGYCLHNTYRPRDNYRRSRPSLSAVFFSISMQFKSYPERRLHDGCLPDIPRVELPSHERLSREEHCQGP